MKTFPLQCAPPADVLARYKPHLRLHYRSINGKYPWSVEYVREPALCPEGDWPRRARRETYQHPTALGAIVSACILWF